MQPVTQSTCACGQVVILHNAALGASGEAVLSRFR